MNSSNYLSRFFWLVNERMGAFFSMFVGFTKVDIFHSPIHPSVLTPANNPDGAWGQGKNHNRGGVLTRPSSRDRSSTTKNIPHQLESGRQGMVRGRKSPSNCNWETGSRVSCMDWHGIMPGVASGFGAWQGVSSRRSHWSASAGKCILHAEGNIREMEKICACESARIGWGAGCHTSSPVLAPRGLIRIGCPLLNCSSSPPIDVLTYVIHFGFSFIPPWPTTHYPQSSSGDLGPGSIYQN